MAAMTTGAATGAVGTATAGAVAMAGTAVTATGARMTGAVVAAAAMDETIVRAGMVPAIAGALAQVAQRLRHPIRARAVTAGMGAAVAMAVARAVAAGHRRAALPL
jgi:hypothetical protein